MCLYEQDRQSALDLRASLLVVILEVEIQDKGYLQASFVYSKKETEREEMKYIIALLLCFLCSCAS